MSMADGGWYQDEETQFLHSVAEASGDIVMRRELQMPLTPCLGTTLPLALIMFSWAILKYPSEKR